MSAACMLWAKRTRNGMPTAADLMERRSESEMPPVFSRLRRQLAVAEGRKDVSAPRSCREKGDCSTPAASSTYAPAADG